MSWKDVIGFGVAGNFTGHLEQAGEAADFVHVQAVDGRAPKGIFPFYIPVGSEGPLDDHFLHRMPISSDTIRLRSLDENHQIEPEVALLCDLTYEAGQVADITPRYAMAHNDCSIRRPGARKISEKKNWGPATKGTSNQRIPIDQFAPQGVLDTYRITCFLLRNGELHPYGVDSPLTGYSYFYERLTTWLIARFNTQIDEGPLEDIPAWLKCAQYPNQALISIGATKYTALGETTYLAPGDRSIVVVYDQGKFQTEAIPDLVMTPSHKPLQGVSILDQIVVPPA